VWSKHVFHHENIALKVWTVHSSIITAGGLYKTRRAWNFCCELRLGHYFHGCD